MGRLTYFAEATSLTPIFDNGNLVGFDYTAIDTQTAADGSTIDLVAEGSAVLIPCPAMGPTWFEAYWDGDFTVVGGTKRFANVRPGTGPIRLWLYQQPFDIADPNTLRPFIFTKRGDIDLGRR